MTELNFPLFWTQIEAELKLQSDEILGVKCLLTILGYTTKHSIKSIKTKKGISELEDEFVKRKNTTNLFEKYYEKYPIIRNIDCFPSGIQRILIQVITHLNRQSLDFDREESAQRILAQGQKFCPELSISDILFETTSEGLSTYITCPICKNPKSISSSFKSNSKTISYTMHNFSRHLRGCSRSAASINATISTNNANDSENARLLNTPAALASPLTRSATKKLLREEIQNEHKKEIAEKENEIATLQRELGLIQKTLVNSQKTMSINLCSLNQIELQGFAILKDSIQFLLNSRKQHLFFDSIFQNGNSQDKFLEIVPFLEDGRDVCVFTHGYTGSGKSCTMFGFENDIGILQKSAQFLLNKGIAFHIEMIEIHTKNSFDCAGIKKVALKSEAQATKLPVANIGTFDEYIKRALMHRIQKATDQNATSSRSHAIFKLVTEKNVFLFADLAGFECQANKPNVDESKFINNSLLELNTVLLTIAAKRTPVCTTILTKFFKNHFLRGNIIMFYHVKAESADTFKTELAKVKDLAVSINVPSRKASRTLLPTLNN